MNYHLFDQREQLPLSSPCERCNATKGFVYESGPHTRLDCGNGHYVKFLGAIELNRLRLQVGIDAK